LSVAIYVFARLREGKFVSIDCDIIGLYSDKVICNGSLIKQRRNISH